MIRLALALALLAAPASAATTERAPDLGPFWGPLQSGALGSFVYAERFTAPMSGLVIGLGVWAATEIGVADGPSQLRLQIYDVGPEPSLVAVIADTGPITFAATAELARVSAAVQPVRLEAGLAYWIGASVIGLNTRAMRLGGASGADDGFWVSNDPAGVDWAFQGLSPGMAYWMEFEMPATPVASIPLPVSGLLMVLALVLLAPSARAATLQGFNPGNSPCLGDCPLDWAARTAGVPMGEPAVIDLPAGTMIEWMSGAQGGVPFAFDAHMVTMQPHAVRGYPLPDGRWMVQFPECRNWAVVEHVPALPEGRAPVAGPLAGGAVARIGGGGGGGWGGFGGGFSVGGGGVIERPPAPETPPAADSDPAAHGGVDDAGRAGGVDARSRAGDAGGAGDEEEEGMSRSGYTDDYDDNWQLIMWRGRVASAIRGKRGQSLLQNMAAALDAMPEKRLIASKLRCEDGVCALGALGQARGIDMGALDPYDSRAVAEAFNIAKPLAQEIVYENDECGCWDEAPETRWQRMRAWVLGNIRDKEATKEAEA